MKSLVRSAIATVCLAALCLAALCVAAASRAGAQQPAIAIPPLRGHVQSPEGRPLADAEVKVEGVKGSARSDVQGLFSLPNVPKGMQTISVRRIGYLPAIAIIDVLPANDSLIVILVPMHTVLDTVKVVAEMNVLAGIVVDENNHPIPGASVDLIGNRRGSATTGSDGWFTFTSVRNGPTILHVVKTGYVGTMQSVQLTDWRGVIVRLSLIDTTLSKAKQEILSGTGNSATFVWHETQTRLAQRYMNAVVVTREELAPLSDLTLGEAIRRAPSASSLSSDLQVINNTVCILLNGNRAVGQQSLDVYDTDDVEFVELYPPGAEPSGSVAAYLRFATCPTTRTRANGRTGIYYAVIWFRN